MDILGNSCVEALGVPADVGDDKRVTTAILKDVKILTLLDSRFWNKHEE